MIIFLLAWAVGQMANPNYWTLFTHGNFVCKSDLTLTCVLMLILWSVSSIDLDPPNQLLLYTSEKLKDFSTFEDKQQKYT